MVNGWSTIHQVSSLHRILKKAGSNRKKFKANFRPFNNKPEGTHALLCQRPSAPFFSLKFFGSTPHYRSNGPSDCSGSETWIKIKILIWVARSGYFGPHLAILHRAIQGWYVLLSSPSKFYPSRQARSSSCPRCNRPACAPAKYTTATGSRPLSAREKYSKIKLPCRALEIVVNKVWYLSSM